MKMQSIKHIVAVAVLGSSLTVATNASAADWNYVGGGFYDFGDTGFYLEGSTLIADRIALSAEIGNTFDTVFRGGVSFLTNVSLGQAPIFVSGGYSDYSFDDGIYFGAGITLALDKGVNTKFELLHDTAGDGFMRIHSAITFAISKKLNLAGSYSMNNRSFRNELRLGVQYKF